MADLRLILCQLLGHGCESAFILCKLLGHGGDPGVKLSDDGLALVPSDLPLIGLPSCSFQDNDTLSQSGDFSFPLLQDNQDSFILLPADHRKPFVLKQNIEPVQLLLEP